MPIEEIKHQSIRWINLSKPNKESVKKLEKDFSFNHLHAEDVLSITQRSKLNKDEKYLFMALLFPVYNRKTKEIESSEVNFFLGKDYLITIHSGNLPPLVDLFELCQTSSQARTQTFENSPELLLYNIIKKLFLYTYPILDRLGLEISEIEEKIFKRGDERKTTEKIMLTRRQVVDLRKIMQAHKNTLLKIKKDDPEDELFSVPKKSYNYFNDLTDYTKEIWDQLENFKEAIETLQHTNESLISFRLNDIMKILTIFSVLLLPPTLIGTLFGMNAKTIPLAEHPLGFYLMIILSSLSALLILLFIWKKKWL